MSEEEQHSSYSPPWREVYIWRTLSRKCCVESIAMEGPKVLHFPNFWTVPGLSEVLPFYTAKIIS